MRNEEQQELLARIHREIGKAFVGKDQTVRLMLIGLFSGLPVLIEDIPGVGKTSLARALAACCRLDFGRIQFTPDLMPADILGLTVWSQEAGRFVFRPGAVMHQFILADEINRAAARTQSALLETMQEGTVSVDGTTHSLPRPFFLVATQNPSGFSGTFPLPEAQLDRFGLSFAVGYPTVEQEERIGQLVHLENPFAAIEPVLGAQDLEELRSQVRAVRIEASVRHYAIQLADATRHGDAYRAGVSPRAGQHLLRAAQAQALLEGRVYVLPEDVRDLCVPVFTHRLSLSPSAKLEGKSVQGQLSHTLSVLRLPSGL